MSSADWRNHRLFRRWIRWQGREGLHFEYNSGRNFGECPPARSSWPFSCDPPCNAAGSY